MGTSSSRPASAQDVSAQKREKTPENWLDEYKHITKKRTVFYHSPRTLLGNPTNIPPWENGTFSVWNLEANPPAFSQTSPQQIQYQTQMIAQNTSGPTQAAYNVYGNSSGTFLDGFLQGLYDQNGYWKMAAFQPHKLAFMPMQPSTLWNNYARFDWSLAALGLGTYESSANKASALETTANSFVTTVMALDPYTGQLKREYTPGTNLFRYTLPALITSQTTQTTSVSAAGFVYHPMCGPMIYGPVMNQGPGTQTAPAAVLNPFKSDPGLGDIVTQRKGGTAQNFGNFVPDIAGVSYGNIANNTSWILTPSCDWDMANLPQYASLAANAAKNSSFFQGQTPRQILQNCAQFPVQSFVKSACLQLTNGTMMVECFPDLGFVPSPNATSYGLVSCGYTNNSSFTGVGVPDGNNTFFLFVNLYYYYDDSLYAQWPDTNAPRPVTSGWNMPRNVTSVCAPPSKAPLVSGSSFVVTCQQGAQPIEQPPVTSGPYPILGNSLLSIPCLPLNCNGASDGSQVGALPCYSGFNAGPAADGMQCANIFFQNKSTLFAPYQALATYPDDPEHVATTPDIAQGSGGQNVDNPTPLLDAQFGAGLPKQFQPNQGIPATNLNQGGQFVTWFDTSGLAAMPISMQVAQDKILIVALGQGAESTTPYFYKLAVADQTGAFQTSISPLTSIKTLKISNLNQVLQTSASWASFSIASVSQAQILDYGATSSGFPLLTLLCTLTSTTASSAGLPAQYPAFGPQDQKPFVQGPAIVTMSFSLDDTNDPTLIDVDPLNAHNNQQAHPVPQGSYLPLVRGLVRTNLSVPALGVISEATNNFAPENQDIYCSKNDNFCSTFFVGDPLQQKLQVQSIDPPSTPGAAPVVTTSQQALALSWNQANTNAALFSHVKLYPGRLDIDNYVTIALPYSVANAVCVVSIEQVDTIVDKTTVWMYSIVGPYGNGNQQWWQQNNQLLLASNPSFALGLSGTTLSLRTASDPSTQWTIAQDGQGYSLSQNGQYVTLGSSLPQKKALVAAGNNAITVASSVFSDFGAVTMAPLSGSDGDPTTQQWTVTNSMITTPDGNYALGLQQDGATVCIRNIQGAAANAVQWQTVKTGSQVLLKSGSQFVSSVAGPPTVGFACLTMYGQLDGTFFSYTTQSSPPSPANNNSQNPWIQQQVPGGGFKLIPASYPTLALAQGTQVQSNMVMYNLVFSDVDSGIVFTMGTSSTTNQPILQTTLSDGNIYGVLMNFQPDNITTPVLFQSIMGTIYGGGLQVNQLSSGATILKLDSNQQNALAFSVSSAPSAPQCNDQALVLGNYWPYASTFNFNSMPPLRKIKLQGVLGVEEEITPSQNFLLYPELDNMRLDIFSQGQLTQMDQQLTPRLQTVPVSEFQTAFNTPSSMLTGWSQDTQQRFQSQFRAHVLRGNLYGPVAQVLSFFPQDLLASPNTDQDLKPSMGAVMAIGGQTTQNTLGYVLSWVQTQNGAPFVSLPGGNYSGTGILSQSVVSPVYGPLMSVAPNQIVHATRSMPADSTGRMILQSYFPLSGAMANPSVNLPVMWSNELDPSLLQTYDNQLATSDPMYLTFPYTPNNLGPDLLYNSYSNWEGSDPNKQTTNFNLPRIVHPMSGLTQCSAPPSPVATAADTGDYQALKWISEYMSTDPSVAPNMNYGSGNQNIVGHRTMFGLQLGQLNLVGPGAYWLGNDQKMIPYDSATKSFPKHAGFGSQQMTNSQGYFGVKPSGPGYWPKNLTPSVTSATCE